MEWLLIGTFIVDFGRNAHQPIMERFRSEKDCLKVKEVFEKQSPGRFLDSKCIEVERTGVRVFQ